MNIEEFLTRYGGTIRAAAYTGPHEFLLTVGRRDYTAPTPQLCVDAALDDAMDYMAAGLRADREIEDVRGERRAD